MSKKHFIALAAIIKSEIDGAKAESDYEAVPAIVAAESIAFEFATYAEKNTLHFNRDLFLAACGVAGYVRS
jgi:hypothetical protein